MKKPWLVVYSSVTGNTRKVAEAIYAVLPAGSEIHPVETAPDYMNFEKVAVGFWADRGSADEKAASYLKKLSNAEIFVFFTLGFYADSPHAQKVLNNALALLGEGCLLLGGFICQAAPADYLVQRAKSHPPGHPRAVTTERLQRWAACAGHPDEKDFAAAQAAVKKLL